MEPPETTDLRRIPVLFLDLAVSQSDTITHTYISTEKTVKNVVDCGCDCSVRNTASSIHILDRKKIKIFFFILLLFFFWELISVFGLLFYREGGGEGAGGGWKGNSGRRAVPFAGECRERVTLCPGVTGAGSPCPRVREGSSRRWGFKGERTLPLWGL